MLRDCLLGDLPARRIDCHKNQYMTYTAPATKSLQAIYDVHCACHQISKIFGASGASGMGGWVLSCRLPPDQAVPATKSCHENIAWALAPVMGHKILVVPASPCLRKVKNCLMSLACFFFSGIFVHSWRSGKNGGRSDCPGPTTGKSPSLDTSESWASPRPGAEMRNAFGSFGTWISYNRCFVQSKCVINFEGFSPVEARGFASSPRRRRASASRS